MLTVMLVYKTGGVYELQDVCALKKQIKEHLTIEHHIVCLTDDYRGVHSLGIQPIQLTQSWPGWWAKMEMFNPYLNFPRVLYFDLDTVIVDNIDTIGEFKGSACFLSDFNNPDCLATGMMGWENGALNKLYEAFKKDWGHHLLKYKGVGVRKGDQGFIQSIIKKDHYRWQDLFPNQIVSYKKHFLKKGMDEKTKVICFHGRPKPRDVGEIRK